MGVNRVDRCVVLLYAALTNPVHHAHMHFAEPSTVQASRQLKGS